MPRIKEIRPLIPAQPTKFMHCLRAFIRARNLALRTEQTYCQWVKRFIKFNNMSHPRDMDARHVEQFLHHLSVVEGVSINTQKSALNALAFLYNKFLDQPLGQLNITKAKRGRKLPAVFSRREALLVIEKLSSPWRLMAELMYGSGLRVSEVVSLRVRDIDLENKKILVHDGKGLKDRQTLLPNNSVAAIKFQIEFVKRQHREDLAHGGGAVFVQASALADLSRVRRELSMQYLFPSIYLSYDVNARVLRRHHLDENSLQRRVKHAIQETGILKTASSHTFRHSFATHLLEDGTNIRHLQELLGHASVSTTEIYTHVLHKNLNRTISPLDDKKIRR